MRAVVTGLSFAAVLATPVLAQGFPGSTVGLPADPFASNYPSAPPPRGADAVPARRDGARRARKPAPRTGQGPVPPAAIRPR